MTTAKARRGPQTNGSRFPDDPPGPKMVTVREDVFQVLVSVFGTVNVTAGSAEFEQQAERIMLVRNELRRLAAEGAVTEPDGVEPQAEPQAQ